MGGTRFYVSYVIQNVIQRTPRSEGGGCDTVSSYFGVLCRAFFYNPVQRKCVRRVKRKKPSRLNISYSLGAHNAIFPLYFYYGLRRVLANNYFFIFWKL